ncbi:MAG TPA: hypothetical protein VGK94_07950 [Candidatus Polarisedimenticolia bacterium]|jgi:hypothetical protein
MATALRKIAIGRADVSLSAYVTAGGAGTFTDVGHTKGPCTIEESGSDYEVKSEQELGSLMSVPIEKKVMLKFAMIEADVANLQKALRQPSGNLTGTPPNSILAVGDPQEEYRQIQLVTKGIKGTATGAAATRTVTIWRGAFVSIEPIGFSKESEQVYGVTVNCLYDESVATADKYYKIVDSGAT